MAVFVVDASATLAWCFEDEANSWTDALLERLRQGDSIVVPAHWLTEVSNGLLMARRKNRIKAGQPETILEELSHLPIGLERALTTAQAKLVLNLSEKHHLTFYDAAYLEIALRNNIPLGTLDSDLRKAAQVEGIVVL